LGSLAVAERMPVEPIRDRGGSLFELVDEFDNSFAARFSRTERGCVRIVPTLRPCLEADWAGVTPDRGCSDTLRGCVRIVSTLRLCLRADWAGVTPDRVYSELQSAQSVAGSTIGPSIETDRVSSRQFKRRASGSGNSTQKSAGDLQLHIARSPPLRVHEFHCWNFGSRHL
jgi:hypothetical protein